MKTHILAFGVALGATIFTQSLHAQWLVVDVDAIAGITKQLEQGAQEYTEVKRQADQVAAMAKQATGLFNFRTTDNPFAIIHMANQYATTADYAVAANADVDPGASYNKTVFATRVDSGLGNLNENVAANRRAVYSTQEIMDGNNLAAMRAVGQIRASANKYRNAMKQIEDDSIDNPDSVQSELAVLQRTSNAQNMGLRMHQDTNQLLASMLDAQIAESKLKRDAIGESTNRALENQDSVDLDSSLWTNVSASIKKWSAADVATH